jgi:hypothetical protein
MRDDPVPQVDKRGGAGAEPPPPFEPDEDLITYLENGRKPKPQVDQPGGAGAGEPPPPFEPDEDLITYLEKGRNT